MKHLRWGILGAARIARKNWRAILNSNNGVVSAVASRDAARAGQFVQECQAQIPFEREPVVFKDYESLLASPDVDAVYVPLPTGVRKHWVMEAARHGKHVLCEKPCAVSAEDLSELIEACARHNVQFMDGVMFMHCPRLGLLREVLHDHGAFGEIRRINSNFNFLAMPGYLETNIRTNAALEPLGCLGDLGWYCVRFSLWAMNWRMPERMAGRVLNERAGVPIEFSGELSFAGGVSAAFYCSFLANQVQTAQVIGSKSTVELLDFVLPFTARKTGFEVRSAETVTEGGEWKIRNMSRRITLGNPAGHVQTAQETLMFRNFAGQVASGTLNNDWPEQALKTQLVVDGCFKSRFGGD
jgi:predicted dehydrogenase